MLRCSSLSSSCRLKTFPRTGCGTRRTGEGHSPQFRVVLEASFQDSKGLQGLRGKLMLQLQSTGSWDYGWRSLKGTVLQGADTCYVYRRHTQGPDAGTQEEEGALRSCFPDITAAKRDSSSAPALTGTLHLHWWKLCTRADRSPAPR